jgi:hypothetical protein
MIEGNISVTLCAQIARIGVKILRQSQNTWFGGFRWGRIEVLPVEFTGPRRSRKDQCNAWLETS